MRGPEHYRKGEELLGYAENRNAEDRGDATDRSLIAEAQAHFLAALVAVNVEAAGLDQPGTLGIASDWARALNGGDAR